MNIEQIENLKVRIAKGILKKLEKENVSRFELARRVGVSASWLYDALDLDKIKGKSGRRASFERLLELADAVGLEIEIEIEN